MKTVSIKNRIITSLVVVATMCFSTGVIAQDMAMTTEAKGVLEFNSKVIDYGTIAQGANGERTFSFTNTGVAPIIISKVKGSCGCTVPTKPKGAIMPGETAEIGVKYDTNRVGAFSKSVTVTSNAAEGTMVLKIKGNVLAKKELAKVKAE